MFSKTLVTLSSLLAAVSAITITAPESGAELDFTQSNTISWTSVETDPESFEIVLIAPNNSSISDVVLTMSATTADGEYSFSNIDTPAGSGYQFNFVSNEGGNKGIISQSQMFEVTRSGSASSTTSSAGSTAASTGASASATSSDTNGASTLSLSFGIAGPIVAALGMLL